MIEIYFNAQSDNGTLTESRFFFVFFLSLMAIMEKLSKETQKTDHALRQWSTRYLQSMTPYKDPRSPLNLANLMTEAGYTDVRSVVYRLPMSAWSSGSFDAYSILHFFPTS